MERKEAKVSMFSRRVRTGCLLVAVLLCLCCHADLQGKDLSLGIERHGANPDVGNYSPPAGNVFRVDEVTIETSGGPGLMIHHGNNMVHQPAIRDVREPFYITHGWRIVIDGDNDGIYKAQVKGKLISVAKMVPEKAVVIQLARHATSHVQTYKVPAGKKLVIDRLNGNQITATGGKNPVQSRWLTEKDTVSSGWRLKCTGKKLSVGKRTAKTGPEDGIYWSFVFGRLVAEE